MQNSDFVTWIFSQIPSSVQRFEKSPRTPRRVLGPPLRPSGMAVCHWGFFKSPMHSGGQHQNHLNNKQIFYTIFGWVIWRLLKSLEFLTWLEVGDDWIVNGTNYLFPKGEFFRLSEGSHWFECSIYLMLFPKGEFLRTHRVGPLGLSGYLSLVLLLCILTPLRTVPII